MRYLLITYYRRADGQIDEAMAVANRVKNSELQTANVIIDFKDRKVIRATADGTNIPKDFERIVSYFHQHYKHVVDRLLAENGLEYREPEAAETPEADTN